jgi:Ras-related protein Rab-32
LTIGVDFASKALNYDDDKDVTLQIWDIAGHERFGTMTRVYYKFAIAGVLVFDLTREATFDAVLKWKEDVNNKVVLANNQNIPLLLLANKADMPDVTINREMLDEFVKTHGFIGWFPVSAKEGTGISTYNLPIKMLLTLDPLEPSV